MWSDGDSNLWYSTVLVFPQAKCKCIPFLKCTEDIQTIFKCILITKTARKVLLPPLNYFICKLKPFPLFVSSAKVRSWPSFPISEKYTGIKVWLRSDTKLYPHPKLQRQKYLYCQIPSFISSLIHSENINWAPTLCQSLWEPGHMNPVLEQLTTWQGRQKPMNTLKHMCYDRAAHSMQLTNRSGDLTHPTGPGKASSKTCCLNWIMKSEQTLARPWKEEENCGQRKQQVHSGGGEEPWLCAGNHK